MNQSSTKTKKRVSARQKQKIHLQKKQERLQKKQEQQDKKRAYMQKYMADTRQKEKRRQSQFSCKKGEGVKYPIN